MERVPTTIVVPQLYVYALARSHNTSAVEVRLDPQNLTAVRLNAGPGASDDSATVIA